MDMKILGGIPVLCLLGSCGGDTKQLSELEEVRVPVVQVLVPQGQSSGVPPSRCRVEADGAPWCQQFPFPASTPGGVLKFVTVTPFSQKPQVVVQRVERKMPNGDMVPMDRSAWGLEPRPSLSTQEKNPRLGVWVQAFSVTVPPEVAVTGGVFSFVFEASDGVHTPDAGVFTVVVPRPGGTVNTNIPPRITAITPSPGVKAQDPTPLEATFEAQPGAKSRFQWYLSRGQVDNEGAKSTLWKKWGPGPQGAFVVVRDLAGGADYAHTWVEP